MASNPQVGVAAADLNGLLNRVRLLLPATRKRVQAAVTQTALLIESDAKLLAPVDTGRLRSSIAAEISSNGLRATVQANVTYAVFLEMGTRYMRARPFLFPAFEKNRRTFIDNLKAAGLK